MGLFGGKSEASKKAEMYEKLANALEEKSGKIESAISEQENVLSSCHTTFTASPDSAEGLIIDTLELHEEVWKGKYERIITNMRSGVQVIAYRKAAARQLSADWKRVAEMEEMADAGF